MARVALLIGTEDYGSQFQKLEAIPRNIKALQEVLESPQMGGFDEVKPLLNPNSSLMAAETEVWLQQRSKDDFVLIYIAGHGIKDMQRQLYFAATNTQKHGNEIVTSTALAAKNLHNWLKFCKARRQVVILDCCFSGAFGDFIAQDDGSVDLQELAEEGRVVLTSSSSMEYSFQQRQGELSVYTHHLLDGIRTGAADLNADGIICADDLHNYTSRKVQEESPAMTPKIIVVKGEGYKLRISNAPLGNPDVKYRKEVELVVQQYGETIKGIGRIKLDLFRDQLGLSDELALSIEDQVLEPIRQRKIKLAKYREIYAQAVEDEYPFEELQLQFLSDIKKMLGVLDEDVAVIEADVESRIQKPEIQLEPVDFSRLERLLGAKQWKEANSETLRLLLAMANRQEEEWLLIGHIRGFSPEDLNTIDALWAEASQGLFGFGIQARLFFEHIEPLGLAKSEAWPKFDDLLAWRKKNSNCYEFSLSATPGHLPHWRKLIAGWGVSDRGYALMERALQCPAYEVAAESAPDVVIEAKITEPTVLQLPSM